MKFKVLRGSHAYKGKVYSRGDVFETDQDLNKHNIPRDPKFLQLDEKDSAAATGTVAVQEEEDDAYTREELKAFTKEELVGIAEEQGVSLPSKATVDQIISAILGE